MSNLTTIRVGSSEYGAASYLTLVNTALHGNMYEQKTLRLVNDKERLHKETLKNNKETNKNDSAKWNKDVQVNTKLAITNNKAQANLPNILLSSPNQTKVIEISLNPFSMSAASSHSNPNLSVKKPIEKQRKKKEISKENDNQVHEKDNISLLIFWEFQTTKKENQKH